MKPAIYLIIFFNNFVLSNYFSSMLTNEGDRSILALNNFSIVPHPFRWRKCTTLYFRTIFATLKLIPFEGPGSLSSNLWYPGNLNSYSLPPLSLAVPNPTKTSLNFFCITSICSNLLRSNLQNIITFHNFILSNTSTLCGFINYRRDGILFWINRVFKHPIVIQTKCRCKTVRILLIHLHTI